MQRKILVTSALPYANGPIHLGHLVEYIQSDIWVRFQRMRGHQVTHICADDAHGTPIMLRAEQEKITCQALIDAVHAEHSRDFNDFMISFDNFYSTHSAENEQLSQAIYRRLRDNGLIYERVITQAYDLQKQMFLPDRYVKGTCPKCKAPDQYGDSCENCGATYAPMELLNPISTVSGKAPVQKDSRHYFFDLPHFETFLQTWLQQADMQREIRNKMQEWFASGLNQWDISRDAPYWGIRIPDTTDKFFYVWLDAPIGYMASFLNYCQEHPDKDLSFDDYFHADSETELYHFIGKDIAYFHTLFWPAMLHGCDYRKPTGVYCHGFLTVNGAKMSKSRGTFIKAQTYLKHLKPEFLRYYFASKLSAGVEDIDLSLDDFKQKNNSDIVGKVINLASRCAGFIHKQFAQQLASELDRPELFRQAAKTIDEKIAPLFEAREYAKALRLLMQLADRGNEYINDAKPWVLIKDANQHARAQAVCTTGINLFYQLIVVLKPIMPALSDAAAAFLNVDKLSWQRAQVPLLNWRINAYQVLAKRIEDKQVQALIADSAASLNTEKPASDSHDVSQGLDTISINDFSKLDLRVATVISCEVVQGSDKLLKFQLDVGELGKRQVFSGIKAYYANPEALNGKKVMLAANLAPRKMRFGLSEGMILSSSNAQGLRLVSIDPGAKAGDKIS